jgi:hypothetical protein
MRRSDRELGMDRAITRRDFLSGMAMGAGRSYPQTACAINLKASQG